MSLNLGHIVLFVVVVAGGWWAWKKFGPGHA
jgi:cytochrome c biogenesis factor